LSTNKPPYCCTGQVNMNRTLATSRTTRTLLALSALQLLVWSPPALALDPSLNVGQFAHTAWTPRDGTLQGGANTIVQTLDGYLWLGTDLGLVRFDGVRMVPWIPPAGQELPSSVISSLAAGRDGSLWIGTANGLVSWKDGKLREHPAIGKHLVNVVYEDRHGTVWAGTSQSPTAKLCAIRDDGTTCVGDDGSLGDQVTSLCEDAAGQLWVGTIAGLWRWSPGPPTRYVLDPSPNPSASTRGRVVSMAPGENGKGITFTNFNNAYQIVDGKIVDYRAEGLPPREIRMRVFRDRDGGVWFATETSGVIRVGRRHASTFRHADGLSSDDVRFVYEDREGSIWLGTGNGLDRFREFAVTSLTQAEGFSDPIATGVLARRDGSVWIGSNSGINVWKDGRIVVHNRRTDTALPSNDVQSFFEDERGRLWIATSRGIVGLEDGKFRNMPFDTSQMTFAMDSDGAGGLWVSHPGGVSHLADGRVIEEMPWRLANGLGPGTGLVSRPGGGVFVGMIGGAIGEFRDGALRRLLTSAEGVGPGRLVDLQRDEHGGMWAATEGGLTRVAADGRVATMTTANGLPCNPTHWMIDDDQGGFWVYSRCGLTRIPRSDVDAWIADPKRKVRTSMLDRSDGVRTMGFMGPYRPHVTRATDGRIWFVSDKVASVLDPRHLKANAIPPPVHIERITVDGTVYAPQPGLRLPPHVRDLSIDYAALSLVAPEKVRVRLRLEGQDPDWREVVEDRHVSYSNLAPGTYRFHVIASNNSGVWNERGDVLEFSIAPAYYQTNAFLVCCAAAFAGLLWTAWHWRLRRVAHRFELTLDARVAERTRIARELHDTLLQSFQGLLLIFESAVRLLPEHPLEARESLERALDQAAEATAEARDAVQGLRNSVTETNDLVPSLTSVAQELSTGASADAAAIEVVVDGTARPLKPLVRDEVYRIAAEALRNAARHAHARHISAEIRYEERQFRLLVRDDGAGIDEEKLRETPSGHFGLHGMRERAAIVGGGLEVLTRAGLGTVVELSIPAPIAYAPARRGPVPVELTGTGSDLSSGDPG